MFFLAVLVGSAAAHWPNFEAALLASTDRNAIQIPKQGGSSLRNALAFSRCEAWEANGRHRGETPWEIACANVCETYYDAVRRRNASRLLSRNDVRRRRRPPQVRGVRGQHRGRRQGPPRPGRPPPDDARGDAGERRLPKGDVAVPRARRADDDDDDDDDEVECLRIANRQKREKKNLNVLNPEKHLEDASNKGICTLNGHHFSRLGRPPAPVVIDRFLSQSTDVRARPQVGATRFTASKRSFPKNWRPGGARSISAATQGRSARN